MTAPTWPEPRTSAVTSRFVVWVPVGAALAYPAVLTAFHLAVSPGQGGIVSGPLAAGFWLAVAFGLPLFCLALTLTGEVVPVLGHVTPATRRVALVALAAPPLYVAAGVVPGLIHSPVREGVIWPVAWAALGLAAMLAPTTAPTADAVPNPRLRVIHGVAGALVALFVAFHLSNHLTGLIGPDLHARVMKAGRGVYRSPVVEPVLVGLLLFQVASGLRMAWRWSGRPIPIARAIQVGSGAYLAAFVLAHLNSALLSARMVHHIDTNWAWAAGLPSGLILDAWDIRLLPHYALGVFFIVTHLFCGLRDVLMAHGVSPGVAGRIWRVGVFGGALLAALIVSGLCGLRL